MRVQFFALGCLLPLLALAGQDRLKYMDYQVTRAQAQAAGVKLAIAGRELDAFLGSDAAKNFDSDGDELPPEVNAIFARAGFDLQNIGELNESEDSTSISALGFAVFKICDGENSALLQLRKVWARRMLELGMLTEGAESKAKMSRERIGTEVLPIIQAYFDSWLATAATHVSCSPQALRYADFALADSTNALADGILGMTRSGLLLDTANGSEGQTVAVLQARRKSLSAIIREAKLLIPKLQKWDPEFESDFSATDVAETFDLINQYDDEFTRLVTQMRSPIWRVGATAAPKIATIGHWRCGTPAAMADIFLAFAAPSWPNATAVLKARDANQILAAYTLARWFETENQISFTNRERFWVEESSTTNYVWQAYGKAETRAEFERAANTITLSAPENGLAIVKLFGHEFLLASGEHNSREPTTATRWYTLAEIQANFRNSSVFKVLTSRE